MNRTIILKEEYNNIRNFIKLLPGVMDTEGTFIYGGRRNLIKKFTAPDGTVVNVLNYSTLAGKTIHNVIEICIRGEGYYFPRMTVQTGKIMLTYVSPALVRADTLGDGESSITYMGNGESARFIPLSDTVISKLEMYNTD